jgi:nucleotide-binding universal stress UspA family protein
MRILLAIDESPDQEKVLEFGGLVACHAGESVTLLAVTEPGNGPPSRAVEGLIARAAAQLQAEQLSVQSRIRTGRAVDEILHQARAGAYGLIVLGGNRHHAWARHWHPSLTAVNVAKRASCWVAVVKGEVRPIRQILLCDSGAHGPTAAPAAEGSNSRSVAECFAKRLPELFGRDEEITVLHVMSQIGAGPGVRGGQLRADADQLMGEHTIEGDLLAYDVRLLERLGVRARAEVRHGLVVDEIVAEARNGDYEELDRPVLVVR